MKNKYWIILFIGIIITVIAPYIFTRPAFCDIFNFSETGNIGSTIGGITAPFLSFLGFIMILISFLEQYRANQKLRQKEDVYKRQPVMPKGNLFGVSKKQKLDYENAKEDWHRKKNDTEEKNNQLIKEYEVSIAKWNDSFDDYVNLQTEKNAKIERIFSEYDKISTNESVSTYFGFILKQAFEEPFNNEIGIRCV